MKKVTLLLAFLLSLHQVSALTCVDLSENLFRTDENSNVKMLQDFLYEKGFLRAAPNGYFGAGTFAAVKEYQAANGINSTGVVGPVTRVSLKTSTCYATPSLSSSPAKTSTTTPQKAQVPVKNETTGTSLPKATTTLPTKIVCTTLTEGLGIGSESSAVLSLQEYLYLKGHLKTAPNGYFGPGTYAAVIAFQNENGITQTGTAGPLTRATIKSESCGTSSTKVTTSATTTKTSTTPSTSVTTVVAAQPKPAPTLPPVPLTKNEQRWKDSDVLLRGIYQYFVSSRGVWPLPASSTSTSPRELCVAPRVTEMASTGEVAVVVTAASPCRDYVDVSYLLPNVLTVVPRDPNLATTSILLGYSILRDELNNISIVPKTTDNKEIIKVRCNFDLKCATISKVSQEEYGVPVISGLSRTVLLKDANAKSGVTISGKNFTSSTTVILQSKTTQRIYEVGPFVSATDGKSFIFDATTTSAELPCGVGCKEKLPLGDYSFQVKTQGGLSNVMYITVKGFTTSSISARANSTVTASTTDVKLGTITVSASLPGTLTSLTLRSTSTSSKLPGKITGFKLKDLSSNKTITASGLTFSLSNTPLADNASRFYDLYANIGNVLVDEAGYITYGGDFLMKDTLGGVDILLPIKEISFSVAPW